VHVGDKWKRTGGQAAQIALDTWNPEPGTL
jgi:hypothetical protein